MAGNNHRGSLAPDKYLTGEQLKRLRRYAIRLARETRSKRDRTNKLIIDILALAGLRASELCDLRLRDCPHVHGKLALIVRNGKGGVSRAPSISNALAARIRRYATRYRGGADPSAPLIANCYGEPVAYHVVWRKVCRLMERSEVRPTRSEPDRHRRDPACHALRHTAASRLLDHGMNIHDLKDHLGHTNLATTEIYLHTSRDAVAKCVNAMR